MIFVSISPKEIICQQFDDCFSFFVCLYAPLLLTYLLLPDTITYMKWIQQTFGTGKPIIAMCHFRALPGDPYYDAKGGMNQIVDLALHELLALQEGGVDAVMFSNEFSLPYLRKVNPETTAAMGRIIGELKREIKIPFGVNVLWDPCASLDLAAATDALFIREIMSGVYASDFGLWDTNVGEIARHRVRLGLNDLKMFYNAVPEASVYLGNRTVEEIAKTTVFNNRPDVICVSGITAGAATDTEILRRVKTVIPETAVFANTGCKVETIDRILTIADGAVVGTTFKKDGLFDNFVDKDRVKCFMDKVRQVRQ
jgi:membrane complex biogenesis BtpA family protein